MLPQALGRLFPKGIRSHSYVLDLNWQTAMVGLPVLTWRFAMGFNAPCANSLPRKQADRAWRQMEQLALKLMTEDDSLTKADAIQKVRQASA